MTSGGSGWPRSRLVAVSAAGVVIVGSLLPWATGPFGIAFSGTSGDGVITLILGGIIGGLALLFPRRWAVVVALLASLAAAATAIYDTAHISSTQYAAVGYGLVLTDVGAVACIVGVVLALRERPSTSPTTQSAAPYQLPPTVTYSPDGRYWWDGYQWLPVQRP